MTHHVILQKFNNVSKDVSIYGVKYNRNDVNFVSYCVTSHTTVNITVNAART